jgi:hypothetical protein
VSVRDFDHGMSLPADLPGQIGDRERAAAELAQQVERAQHRGADAGAAASGSGIVAIEARRPALHDD